jgi:hypothetical protein
MTLSSTSEPTPESITIVKPTKIRESDVPLTKLCATGAVEKQVEVTTFNVLCYWGCHLHRRDIPSDAEFDIHVGDIFFKRGKTCLEQD